MAEALGLVASSIAVVQLAAGVGQALMKLKNLWDEIKDVPESIKTLMEEVTLLHLTLQDIEDDVNRQLAAGQVLDTTQMQCFPAVLRYCRSAETTLSDLVKFLDSQIASPKTIRRQLGKIRMVMKKESIQVHEQRLQRAITLLILANQEYTKNMITSQMHMIRTMATLQQQSLQPCTNATGSTNESIFATSPKRDLVDRLAVSRLRSDAVRRYRVPFLTTLLNYTWEVAVSKSYGSWQVNLQPYNIISDDSPVFRLINEGDTPGVLDLFARGLASPFDHTKSGRNLLHHAIRDGDLELNKFLISRGVDIHEKDIQGLDPLILIQHRRKAINLVELRDICLSQSDSPEGMGSNFKFYIGLTWGRLHLDHTYQEMLEAFDPCHYSKPISHRTEKAMDFSFYFESLDLLRFFFWKNGRPREEDIVGSFAEKFSPFHLIVWWFGRQTAERGFAACLDNGVLDFMLEILRLLGPLRLQTQHQIDRRALFRYTRVFLYRPLSPLFIYLGGFSFFYLRERLRTSDGPDLAGLYSASESKYSDQAMRKAIEMWLSLLQRAFGVEYSLSQYGQAEETMSRSHLRKSLWVSEYPLWNVHDKVKCAKLEDFRFGPKPGDWSIEWDHVVEQNAGEFWRSLERSSPMPGSWVEQNFYERRVYPYFDSDSDSCGDSDSEEISEGDEHAAE